MIFGRRISFILLRILHQRIRFLKWIAAGKVLSSWDDIFVSMGDGMMPKVIGEYTLTPKNRSDHG
jgi:hypothetical protein